VAPYSFTFTLMIRIVSADLPTEVVEIPGSAWLSAWMRRGRWRNGSW
jgi:hypothetical protein